MDRVHGVRTRDRIVGAIFVMIALAAQVLCMGGAASLLRVGIVVAYLLWVAGRWKNDPAAVLPIFLLAIAVQCVHFAEEYLTGFQHQFPRLLGYDWSDERFAAFNVAWLAMFGVAALGVYRRVGLAYLVVLFVALAGGVGNGIGHLLLSATPGPVFPWSGYCPSLPSRRHRAAPPLVLGEAGAARAELSVPTV